MRLIDADELRKQMYHEAFETDTDMQKWDSGCWIRYKMFENAIENAPFIDAEPVIRCKDCYFCGEIDEDGWHWCQCTGADMPKDGFCPHAVRKRMERGNKNEMDKCRSKDKNANI